MSDHITLVTGASSDIGNSTIKFLLKENKKVWGIYNTQNKKMLELQNEHPKNLKLSRYNFLIKNNIRSFLEEISVNSEYIKSFISLASLRDYVGYGKISIDDLNRHYQVNVIPVVLAVQCLGKAMASNGYGRIVIGSSIGVKFGGGQETFCYSLTKLASELIPNIAKDWAKMNVLLNVVRIGVTNTSSMRNTPKFNLRKNLIPMGRAAFPEEVANFLIWLSSTENTFITNQVISFSGGE